MTVMEIRSAELEDAGDLLSIYRPIVEKTATSFELTPPTEKEFADRTETVSQTHTWLVAEEDSRLSGYAYATQHKPRAAYKFSVETSAYVHSDFRGSRIARHLYDRLFDEFLSLGICHAFTGITLPNPASVALH